MYDTIPLLPLAALFDFDHRIINELIPIAGIILAGVITVSAMYFSHHQKKMLHETTRLALERGQPLSPELIATLRNESRCSRGGRNDIRKGLILMAVGAVMLLIGIAWSASRRKPTEKNHGYIDDASGGPPGGD